MQSPNRSSRHQLALAAAACLLGAPALSSAAPKDSPPALAVPFRYEGFGVGAGAVQDTLVLKQDSEAVVVSRALVNALQAHQLSVVKPTVGLGVPLPQNQAWESDVAPVPPELVAAYNRANPNLALGPRKWSIQYSGQYKLERRQLLFSISAKLYEAGFSGPSKPYKGPYSGAFFVSQLTNTLQTKLMQQGSNAP